MLLSQALLDERRIEAAAYEADRAAELEPEWFAVHCQRAAVLFMMQHKKEALAAAEQAIALAPQASEPHLLHARILRLMNQRTVARESLARALERNPFSVSALAEQGFAALEAGDLPLVETAARAILELDPTNVDGIVLIGQVQLVRGDTQEAQRLALAALSMNPVDTDALQLLADVKVKTNPLGGLWWRWNRLIVKLGVSRAI
ncbi:unnamed protein product, partial [Laminaria digitata]